MPPHPDPLPRGEREPCYPAASGVVSEDGGGMIMPPHPDPLPPGEREKS